MKGSPEKPAVVWMTVALLPVDSHMAIGSDHNIVVLELVPLLLFHFGIIHEHFQAPLGSNLHGSQMYIYSDFAVSAGEKIVDLR